MNSSPAISNVRRAELLDAQVAGDRASLRLVFRNSPMRVTLSREQAARLVDDLAHWLRECGK
jgi:hypothetical protein